MPAAPRWRVFGTRLWNWFTTFEGRVCLLATPTLIPVVFYAWARLQLPPVVHLRRNYAGLIEFCSVSYALAFWLSLWIVNLKPSDRGQSNLSCLSIWGRIYLIALLVILEIWVNQTPLWEVQSIRLVFDWPLFALLVWLVFSSPKRYRIRRWFPVGLIAFAFITTGMTRCPHALTVRVLGINIALTGTPCRNEQTFEWWWSFLRYDG